MENKLKKYKEAMHKAMNDKKFSPYLLSKVSFVNINLVYRVLNGNHITTHDSVIGVAKALDLDVHELMLYRLKCGAVQSNKEKAEVLDYMVREKMIPVLEEV